MSVFIFQVILSGPRIKGEIVCIDEGIELQESDSLLCQG